MGNRCAVFAWVGSAVIHFGVRVVHDRLSPAHHVREVTLQIDLMTPPFQLRSNLGRESRFHHHVRAGECQLHETRSLERLLDVEAVVDDVGDDLDVRLRLVPASHDAESDTEMIALHERRDYGLQRAFSRRERVGVMTIEVEQAAAVLEHESGTVGDDRRSERREIALNERRDIALTVDGAEIRRIAGVHRELTSIDTCICAARIDQARALPCIRFRQQRVHGNL